MGKKNRAREDWVSSAIPRALADRARKEALPKGEYPSLTAFIADAVRRRLEDLKEAA